ncbi:hypothetical protein BGS1_15760 [Clostridium beijerinckii]|nr:hypothetical protein BGS1_15760 [Clostridium beijerinckii]
MPYYPMDSDEGHYEVNTIEEKTVSNYTGYDFDRVDELEVFQYWLLLRDAIVYKHLQTKEGREYLEKCWIMEQTKPDRQSLREKMGKN